MHEIELCGYTARTADGAALDLGTWGSSGIEQLHVTLGADWQGLAVQAVFATPLARWTLPVPADGVVPVPAAVTAAPLQGGAYGTLVFWGRSGAVQRVTGDLPFTVSPHTPVEGASPAEQYKLQARTAAPSRQDRQITPEAGYYGLSAVTVQGIPAAWQDVTPVTAAAADVRAGRQIVNRYGAIVAGTLPDIGAVAAELDGLTSTVYTVPAGCHSGTGTVTLTDDIERALAAL